MLDAREALPEDRRLTGVAAYDRVVRTAGGWDGDGDVAVLGFDVPFQERLPAGLA